MEDNRERKRKMTDKKIKNGRLPKQNGRLPKKK